MLLWGPYDDRAGHWIDAERLMVGEAPEAAALEMLLTSENGKIDSALVAQSMHERYGIKDAAVLSRYSVMSESQSACTVTPFYEVCSYTVGDLPMVWWLTMDGLGGVVVGCSRLEYYTKRKHLQPTYEAVGTMIGPWDLDIRQFI